MDTAKTGSAGQKSGFKGAFNNRRRRPRGPRKFGGEKWTPTTKLGRLVQAGKITTIEEIYLHSIPIKECRIVEELLKDKLEDQLMKLMSVQKQTRAGQRTSLKAFVLVGDRDGHVGLGVKSSREAALAIRAAVNIAKMNIIPVRRGYWGSRIGKPHTVPCKVTGKCGSVSIRLIPAPRGTGIVASRIPKKVLELAGFDDVFTSSIGHTRTLGNFIKATVNACEKTYQFLTPDLWGEAPVTDDPRDVHADLCAAPAK
ncbi:hypothetical protein PCE1_002646 [Barthelona sp. PCE]